MIACSGRNFRRVAQFDPEQSLPHFARSCHLPTEGGNWQKILSHWKFELRGAVLALSLRLVASQYQPVRHLGPIPDGIVCLQILFCDV